MNYNNLLSLPSLDKGEDFIRLTADMKLCDIEGIISEMTHKRSGMIPANTALYGAHIKVQWTDSHTMS